MLQELLRAVLHTALLALVQRLAAKALHAILEATLHERVVHSEAAGRDARATREHAQRFKTDTGNRSGLNRSRNRMSGRKKMRLCIMSQARQAKRKVKRHY